MVQGNVVLLILSREGKRFAQKRSVPDLKPSKDTRNPSRKVEDCQQDKFITLEQKKEPISSL